MNETSQVRRPQCARCLRPQTACICRWIAPVDSSVEVLILQHPLEVGNAKGSARLLHLSLPNSRMAVGEVFDKAALQALLHAPWEESRAGQIGDGKPRQPVLLYPEMPAGAEPESPEATGSQAAGGSTSRGPEQMRLVVLDATWRKSRKMLYANPLLQTLPRLALSDPPPSRYRVRKAHAPHQLSTLEAACQALAQLEADEEKYRTLLQAFDGFVDQQLGYRPGQAIGRLTP